MKIPAYVTEMMGRADWYTSYALPGSDPGYTIRIRKATPYSYASTLQAECERLCAWARRQYADARVLYCPTETHHRNQYAVVVISDPVMQRIEKLINT